jgi:hypothetical protein
VAVQPAEAALDVGLLVVPGDDDVDDRAAEVDVAGRRRGSRVVRWHAVNLGGAAGVAP